MGMLIDWPWVGLSWRRLTQVLQGQGVTCHDALQVLLQRFVSARFGMLIALTSRKPESRQPLQSVQVDAPLQESEIDGLVD